MCEFGDGQVLRCGDRPAVAWSYPEPWSGYEAIAGHYAFYPGRVDCATVDGEPVEAQPGDLRRLDHLGGDRAVQGRPGVGGLVTGRLRWR